MKQKIKRIYLDTNAFYFFFFEHTEYTKGIKKIFDKIQKGKLKGITSCLTLDELAYVVLMRLIEKKYNKHPMDIMRKSRTAILEFIEQIKEVFNVIFSFDNLEIMDANKDMVGIIPIMMEETLLLPRDCIHLRTMADTGCNSILTTDGDFDGLDGVNRIDPSKEK